MQYLDLQEHTFICDLYLPMANQFVCMGRKHMNSSKCGWGQQKHTICSAYEPCYVIQSEHKQVFSDDLMMLTACSDDEMSRSGYFCVDNRWRQMTDKTNHFTPCACAWFNNYIFESIKISNLWLMLYNRPFAKLGLKDQLRHIAMQRKKN